MVPDKDSNFSVIDIDLWERKEYFRHYYDHLRCTYSITANIDITAIYNQGKDLNRRMYPTLIWWISNAVNHFEYLRFNHDEDGNIGYYNTVNPSFTYMTSQSDKFHVLWCEYSQNFQYFYDFCIEVMDGFDAGKMFPMADMPNNCFDISSIPWIEFTSFNLNAYTSGTHLPPIFTMGKMIKENSKTKLPLCLQVHHAVCDGYHVGQCFSYLQELADKPDGWMC